MKLLAITVLLGALVGCGSPPLPEPTVTGLSPAQMRGDQFQQITVELAAVFPFHVDYTASPHVALDSTNVQLRIGSRDLGEVAYRADRTVQGTVAPFYLPGRYDVAVTFPDGNEGVLTGGFEVTAGQWPNAYSIDPVGTQIRGVPFKVSVRALGVNGATFGGAVRLSVSKGNVTPNETGAFVNGVREEEILLTGATGNVTLTATDTGGNNGSSGNFQILP
jgi:hypothetical protein